MIVAQSQSASQRWGWNILSIFNIFNREIKKSQASGSVKTARCLTLFSAQSYITLRAFKS